MSMPLICTCFCISTIRNQFDGLKYKWWKQKYISRHFFTIWSIEYASIFVKYVICSLVSSLVSLVSFDMQGNHSSIDRPSSICQAIDKKLWYRQRESSVIQAVNAFLIENNDVWEEKNTRTYAEIEIREERKIERIQNATYISIGTHREGERAREGERTREEERERDRVDE